jgi:hypothetical protein
VLGGCADDVASGDETTGETSTSSSTSETSSSVGESESSSTAEPSTSESSSSSSADTSSSGESSTGEALPCGCALDEVCIERTTDACGDPHVPITACITPPASCTGDDFVCDSACGWETCGGPGCIGLDVEVCGAVSEGTVCGTGGFACNLYADSCPEGEKCTSWDNDGDQTFNGTRCAPIDPAPVPIGSECTFEGSPWSGIDNCDLGAMCLVMNDGDITGICRAACVGNPYDASCDDPEMTCVIEEDFFGWCLPS